MNNLAENARHRGAYHAALSSYQEALTIAREIGDRGGEMMYLSNSGVVRVQMEEYADAEADLRQAIAMAGDEGNSMLPETYSFLALACVGQEKLEDAVAVAQRAYELAHASGNPELIGGAWRTLGQVAARLKTVQVGEQDYTSAACFAESLRVYTESGMEGEQAETLAAWAEYELTQGDQAKGETMWQEARALFAKIGADKKVERMDARRKEFGV